MYCVVVVSEILCYCYWDTVVSCTVQSCVLWGRVLCSPVYCDVVYGGRLVYCGVMYCGVVYCDVVYCADSCTVLSCILCSLVYCVVVYTVQSRVPCSRVVQTSLRSFRLTHNVLYFSQAISSFMLADTTVRVTPVRHVRHAGVEFREASWAATSDGKLIYIHEFLNLDGCTREGTSVAGMVVCKTILLFYIQTG